MPPMNVLVIGSGGREHALCWKLSKSPRKPKLFCAPGNAGTANLGRNLAVSADDIDGLLKVAKKEKIDLTIVGPEDPLCAGIVDRFESAGLRIFGPCAAAARLEGDKAFSKQLMRESGVPTAEARVFGPTDQEIAQARQSGRGRDEQVGGWFQRGYDMANHYVSSREEGIVVKACGLAKGKGVFVHPDPKEALLTIEELMIKRTLGEAGDRLVIEELLIGREVSVMALIDGHTIYILETAADYKRAADGDCGPNTGGMGAYSPSPAISDSDMEMIQRDVFVPIVDALKWDGVNYRGVLYAGLMLTAGGPKVLEFNCRLGDPETQPLMMRLQNDLLDVIDAVLDGRLDQMELRWDPRAAVCVVMASGGYPGEYKSGHVISGLKEAGAEADVQVFHAGTGLKENEVISAGGRVLGVTALGDTLEDARARAYDAARQISFQDMYMRSDIAATPKG
jgi:phosphoribosylamine--glycine ligase